MADDQNKPRGPLQALEGNPFSAYKKLKQYPLEGLGQREEIPNYVMFYINLPEKSKYEVERVRGVTGTSYNNRLTSRGTETAKFADSIPGFTRYSMIKNPDQTSENSITNNTFQYVQDLAGNIDVSGVAKTATGSVGAAAYSLGVLTGGGIIGSVVPGIAAAAMTEVLDNVQLRPRTNRIVEAIQLYMPDTVMQRDQMDYDQLSIKDAMGELRLYQMAANKLPGVIDQVGGMTANLPDTIPTIDKIVVNTQAGISALASDPLGAELIGRFGANAGITDPSLIGALLKSQGVAMNPQLEMIFMKKDFRTFQFDFRFQPRSLEESNIVKEIINTFRRYSAPELATVGGVAGQYYIPPAEFDIEYYAGSTQNQYIPKISSCVLESVDVNYSQAGQFATFDVDGGPPVQIGMVLTFREVDVITREMIDEGF